MPYNGICLLESPANHAPLGVNTWPYSLWVPYMVMPLGETLEDIPPRSAMTPLGVKTRSCPFESLARLHEVIFLVVSWPLLSQRETIPLGVSHAAMPPRDSHKAKRGEPTNTRPSGVIPSPKVTQGQKRSPRVPECPAQMPSWLTIRDVQRGTGCERASDPTVLLRHKRSRQDNCFSYGDSNGTGRSAAAVERENLPLPYLLISQVHGGFSFYLQIRRKGSF